MLDINIRSVQTFSIVPHVRGLQSPSVTQGNGVERKKVEGKYHRFIQKDTRGSAVMYAKSLLGSNIKSSK